jgi:hypothetical protein
MKNLVNLLIGLSAVSTVFALISKLTQQPILGVGAKSGSVLSAILLLFAIALSVKK